MSSYETFVETIHGDRIWGQFNVLRQGIRSGQCLMEPEVGSLVRSYTGKEWLPEKNKGDENSCELFTDWGTKRIFPNHTTW